MRGVAWCFGGSDHLDVFSWAGPGSNWIRRRNLAEDLNYYSVVYDETHKAIWALASEKIYMYSLDDDVWQLKKTFSEWFEKRWRTGSVLCGSYIFTLGGQLEGPGLALTNMILLTDTRTGQTVISNTTANVSLWGHVVALVTPRGTH